MISFATASECSSRNPAKVVSAPVATPSASEKVFTLSIEPNEPLRSPIDDLIAEIALPNAAPTSFTSSLNTFQYFPALSSTADVLSASPEASKEPTASTIPLIALIPAVDSTSNAGDNLLDTVSCKPSIAWSTVLYCVASLVKLSFVPTFAIASKKSSVFTLPSCTFLTSSFEVIPIDFAI